MLSLGFRPIFYKITYSADSIKDDIEQNLRGMSSLSDFVIGPQSTQLHRRLRFVCKT